MDLDEYVRHQKFARRNLADVAADIGITTSYLSELKNRKKVPTLATAQKIVTATGGQVGFADLLPGTEDANAV